MQSAFGQNSKIIISDIYKHFNTPTLKTQGMINGWKEDFEYIYGNIDTNISSNSKLDIIKILQEYNITSVEQRTKSEEIQLLFFSIQTYFSLLIKTIVSNILQGNTPANISSSIDIITGKFTEKYGIQNYCYEDWYCWPVFELENGFEDIMKGIQQQLDYYDTSMSIKEFLLNSNYDYIKQIYEAIIPKELRHALGEYYTPDWLAEYTISNAISSFRDRNLKTAKILDPTCGSGTFLFKSIMLKRRECCTLEEIVNSVFGFDINPLAVLTAKTNYLLCILDLLDPNSNITIPVYNVDIVRFPQDNIRFQKENFLATANPADAVRKRILIDRQEATCISNADIIVGNPPWVNWEYMPEKYRKESQHLWIDYKLFYAKGRDLSFSKEDISVLITYIVIDKLLSLDGIIAFVIRQGVFKSAQNGVGFRRFKVKDDCDIQVIKVDDLSKIRAFENATNSTAIFFARKGRNTNYPIPYYLWEKRKDISRLSFNSYSQLQEITSQINIVEQQAIPTVKNDITSLWMTAEKSCLSIIEKGLGNNEYKARTGVFTGGANAVYWITINSANKSLVSVTNLVERAKRKVCKTTTDIEPKYIFPMLKGSNIKKWNISYETYLICPHTAETKMWPIPQSVLKEDAPKTFNYLYSFKDELDKRNGFAGWEKEIQQKEFHAILRIGDYTFSKYKVVWKYIASEFICAVVGTVNDRYLGEKTILPNEKVMYVSTDCEMEAYYLCGILSSTLIAQCVKSYMNPTSISAHILDKLNIPKYDTYNEIHNKIACICKEGHNHENVPAYIDKIDELVEYLY